MDGQDQLGQPNSVHSRIYLDREGVHAKTTYLFRSQDLGLCA